MTAIRRRSIRSHVPQAISLADADDVDGFDAEGLADDVLGGSQTKGWIDVTGCSRVIISSFNGTLGTLGIDQVQVSHDGGASWTPDTTLMLASANDFTGNIVANAALEAAGVDPVTANASLFKSGPYQGPTYMRVCRDSSDAFGSSASGVFKGTDWSGGAPSVSAVRIY